MSSQPSDSFPFDKARLTRWGSLPRCKVFLLGNPTHDLMFVVRTIMELTRLCRAEATHKMWEAHHNGRSLLLITHRERAELYAEQFASRDLLTLLEVVT